MNDGDSSAAALRVCVVEDAANVRESLIVLLNGAPGFVCCGAFASAEVAVKQIPVERPDVVLMDIHLPRMSGIACVRELKLADPTLLIVMLTAFGDDDLLFDSLKAGASGYLLKPMPPHALLDALREVIDGGAPMSGNIARKVIRSFHGKPTLHDDATALSPREREILGFLARGYLYKEIAKELDISGHTVQWHLRSVYEKLHVRNRGEAVRKFLQS